jgi:hypothetical protein
MFYRWKILPITTKLAHLNDFEKPHRVWGHGAATLSKKDILLVKYNEADLIARVAIEGTLLTVFVIFINM